MYRLALLISLFFTFSDGKAQPSKEIIEVKAEVLGLGNEINDTINNFYRLRHFTRVEIRNTQDTAINFYILSCPAEVSFLTDNDSIHFRSEFIGCDVVIPDKIKLQPKQRLIINGSFLTYSKTVKREFKLGFAMLSFSELFDLEFGNNKNRNRYNDFLKKRKIYWSDKIILRDSNAEYYIENF